MILNFQCEKFYVIVLRVFKTHRPIELQLIIVKKLDNDGNLLLTSSMSDPVHVLITGAAGQIGYVLTFRIANGDLFGNRKVFLHLLELKPSMGMLEAVIMELNDCNFPNLAGVSGTDDVKEACRNVDVAFLIGAIPKRANVPIQAYLERNAITFKEQGEALSKFAKPTVKVLVVGMPANTNCLVALCAAKNLKPENFCAMTRLDHNRVVGAISKRINIPPEEIKRVAVWGNRSSDQVLDVSHTTVNGKPLSDYLSSINNVSKELTAIIESRTNTVMKMRGASTAASAANAALRHMHDWLFGTAPGDFVSMAIPVPDSAPYGIHPGIVFSFPCTVNEKGEISIVEDLELSDEIKEKIRENEQIIRNEAQMTADVMNGKC
ncbi:malate dehydrogenase [Tritrichomonas foetus]|uniref:malate dehydrogenase n=1 Tax=Tritrichomonas foetus TaxID=1144522 RepID=A0A1J4KQI8_9EUKA|nr:malate dehydrogenase [Tritrichomonas foetus]|eukprot:OHT12052.1 malate dehydrogenase [Tritrichomonas foetus]